MQPLDKMPVATSSIEPSVEPDVGLTVRPTDKDMFLRLVLHQPSKYKIAPVAEVAGRRVGPR
eukprot:11174494-Lingulodinium_polyedra.AAC.1